MFDESTARGGKRLKTEAELPATVQSLQCEVAEARAEIAALRSALAGSGAAQENSGDGGGGKSLERELRRHRALLSSVIDHAPVSFSIKDLDRRYLLANPRFFQRTGLRLRDIIGKSVAEVFPESAATIDAIEDEVLASGLPVERSFEFKIPSGETLYITNKWFPIFGEDGELAAYGAIGLDGFDF